MSTKRLSRTVLEAGQWRYRWHYDKCAIRAERTEARVRGSAARRDASEAEQLHIRPRKHLGKMFASDKLGAVERWLLAQVGRPWAKLEGEILSRFDTRSLAGRHIVFEHLLPGRHERTKSGWVVHRRWIFSVDDHGILCARQRARKMSRTWIRPATVVWLADRKIAIHRNQRDGRAYWLIPVSTPEPTRCNPPRFRQGARLGPPELERLAQFNQAEREAFVVECGDQVR